MACLTELLSAATRSSDSLQLSIDPTWMQGRGAYGGIQAIAAVEAMQPLHAGLPLRTLQATLCAPVPAGIVTARATLLRAGKNTRQIEARLFDGETLLAIFIGIFGSARESVVQRDYPHPALGAAGGMPFPFIPGVMPDFLQHFDATLLRGHLPGSHQPDTTHTFRLGLKDSAPEATLNHVLAFADYPPPIALSWLRTLTPASTMTWMLTLTGHPFTGQPLADWLVDVELDAGREGYTQQTVTVFTPDGRPIARGTQCMVVFG